MQLLTDHATIVVSGTKIAGEIGASRSAVWRMVQQLRGYGLEIEGHPTTGYLLKKVPDLLLPEVLHPFLQGTIFRGRLHHAFSTGSTNADAMEAAAQGAPEGSCFVAEEQTAGRGRGGHNWHSAKYAGIYCSVVLRPQVAPRDALALSLAAGLAVQAAVREVTGLEADLRWPNDLLLGGKKFCGILTEMNAEPTRVRYAVAGIGINVNHETFPPELRELATSLRLEGKEGKPWRRVELLAALLQALHRECRGANAPSAIFRRFESHSSYARGRRVHVEEDGGYDGVTEGLDEAGFLRVKTAYGSRIVLSGQVRPAAKN